eukprot:gene7448-588_t
MDELHEEDNEMPAVKTWDLAKLEGGSAEVFGAELQLGQSVNISGQKLAVFTWTGAQLIVDGKPSVMYVCDETETLPFVREYETPMASYLNVHNVLMARREEALKNGTSGPRVIVVGPTDCGKSTICKMFANWAVRNNFEPTMVDLDVGQGSITVPGCVAATPVEAPIDIEDGYSLEMPLVYFYGHASPSDNPELYKVR